MIEAKIIADSINPDGKRITTVQCRYPRFIHSQVMTHRMFSRNAQSSRACPVDKMIKEVEENPAMPIHWGANQSGMQADEECNEVAYVDELTGWRLNREEAWEYARDYAVIIAKSFSEAGYHKQIVNRLLEPFMHISVIITATEWDNFFALRLHDDAQPEIKLLAERMKGSMDNHIPNMLEWGDWHMPYIRQHDNRSGSYGPGSKLYHVLPGDNLLGDLGIPVALKCSSAACARVSYNNHDKSERSWEKDINLHDSLLESGHMSPFEHQARAMRGVYSNFNGWCQYRWELENE